MTEYHDECSSEATVFILSKNSALKFPFTLVCFNLTYTRINPQVSIQFSYYYKIYSQQPTSTWPLKGLLAFASIDTIQLPDSPSTPIQDQLKQLTIPTDPSCIVLNRNQFIYFLKLAEFSLAIPALFEYFNVAIGSLENQIIFIDFELLICAAQSWTTETSKIEFHLEIVWYLITGIKPLNEKISFQLDTRPLIIWIGGTSGSGKSKASMELANLLNFSKVVATDALRDALRPQYPQEHVIWSSTYNITQEIWDGSARVGDAIFSAFQKQVECVASTFKNTIQSVMSQSQTQYAIERFVPRVIVEGVHVTPEEILKFQDSNVQQTLLPSSSASSANLTHHDKFGSSSYINFASFLYVSDAGAHKERLSKRPPKEYEHKASSFAGPQDNMKIESNSSNLSSDPKVERSEDSTEANKYVKHFANIQLLSNRILAAAQLHHFTCIDNLSITDTILKMLFALKRIIGKEEP